MPFTFKLSQRLARMRRAVLLLSAPALAACELRDGSLAGPSQPGQQVVKVMVSPGTVTLTPSENKQFGAYGRTQAGDSVAVAVSWSATGGTISSSGLYAAGPTAGAYQVTATESGGSLAGSASVTVLTAAVAAVAAVASVEVSPASASAVVGESRQFTAILRDANGNILSGRTVSWASSNAGVVAVNANGLATAVAVGIATISCTSEGKTGQAQYTVTAAPVASVSVSPASGTISVGQSFQLVATLRDAGGTVLTGRVVTWATSNGGVATVSSGGLVTGVAVGTAAITATSEGQIGTAAITVASAPPAADGEPVFNPATDQLMYQDNIDGYTSAAAMWADNSANPRMQQSPGAPSGDPDASDILLSPGRGGAGNALRLSYSGANQEAHGWNTVNVPTTGGRQRVFFTYWARATFSSPLSVPLGLKWFMARHPAADRTQWSLGWGPNGNYLPGISYWRVNPQSRGEFGTQVLPPTFNDILDGQWHRYTYEYLAQSAPGARDGVARMWVDGKKIIDISLETLNVTPPGGLQPWCTTADLDALAVNIGVSYLTFGSVQTATTAPWTLDIDDLQQWTRP